MAVQHFGKVEQKKALDREVLARKARKAKLNGEIVAKITGLQGKELGLFMQELKKVLTPEVLDQDSAEVVSLKVTREFLNFVSTKPQ